MLSKELAMDHFASCWTELKNSLDHIFSCRTHTLSFSDLHRSCYKLVVSGCGATLYSSLNTTLGECVESRATQFILSSSSDALEYLKDLEKEYSHFIKCSKTIASIFMYLDRAFCYPRHEFPILLGAQKLFGEKFLGHEKIKSKIMQNLTEVLVTRKMYGDTHNETEDKPNLTFLLNMMYESDPVLSISSHSFSCENPKEFNNIRYQGKIYETLFEIPFLDALKSDSQKTSSTDLGVKGFSFYMKTVRQKIDFELARATEWFRPCTIERIEKVLIDAWIFAHAETLVEMSKRFFFEIVDEHNDSDLAYLFTLLSHSTPKLNIMRETLIECARDTVVSLIKTFPVCGSSVEGIQCLIQFRARCLYLMETVFQKHEEFSQRLLHCFEECIRSNPYVTLSLVESFHSFLQSVTHEEWNISICPPEMVTEDENYSASFIAKVYGHLDLFRYIGSKDVFEQAYREFLASRVSTGLNRTGYRLESHIIELFSIECGTSYTVKLKGLLKDCLHSETIHKDFLKEQKDKKTESPRNKPCEQMFRCLIFTQSNWPFKINDLPKIRLPQVLLECQKTFEKFYTKTFPTQDLTWLTCMGSAILSTSFPYGPKEIYTNTLQMIILLLFNKKKQLRYHELLAQIDPSNVAYFHRCLLSLCHSQAFPVLCHFPTHPKPAETHPLAPFSPDDMFELNTTESYSSPRLYLSPIPVKEQDTFPGRVSDRRDTHHVDGGPSRGEINDTRLLEERGVIMDSSIVHIMKSHKILTHTLLTTQVVQTLKNRFHVVPTAVEQRIQHLIERGFLERISLSPASHHHDKELG